MNMVTITQFEIRLLVALLLGTAIGFERQWRHKMAGVKTNALVSLGSALFILLGAKILGDSSGEARIAAQIVTGIGFLGAGAIVKSDKKVTGVTTAAFIWAMSGISILIGSNMYLTPIILTLLIVLLTWIFELVEKRLHANHPGEE